MSLFNVMQTLGGDRFSDHERAEQDYYATPPKATEALLDRFQFAKTVWEPCCGGGHISKVLQARGYDVISTDIVDRGYGQVADFFSAEPPKDCDIVTNPPYKNAVGFAQRALDCVSDGHKVAMLLRIQFLEGIERGRLFDKHPPRFVFVARARVSCGMNGDFTSNNSAMCFAWFVWEKGYKGKPEIEWFLPKE